MSDTPRTDAALIERNSTVSVDASVARQLERELADANSKIRSMQLGAEKHKALAKFDALKKAAS
jgi:hypothetical protein